MPASPPLATLYVNLDGSIAWQDPADFCTVQRDETGIYDISGPDGVTFRGGIPAAQYTTGVSECFEYGGVTARIHLTVAATGADVDCAFMVNLY